MTAVGPTETVQPSTYHDELQARMEMASRSGALAADARDHVELFRALYAETARVMDVPVFLLALYDDTSQMVHVVRQIDRGVEHEGGSFPLGKGFTSEVIRTGVPKLIRNWATEGPPVRLLYGTESGELVAPQSGCVVPIRSGERILGAISVQSYRPDAFQEREAMSLAALAAQAAVVITQLRVTERIARDHEQHALQLESVLASMSEALLIVDARGAIVRLNRAARELLRLDASSLVLGQPLDEAAQDRWPVSARAITAALVPVVKSIREGKGSETEVELQSYDRRLLRITASVLRSSASTVPLGGVIALHDITERRALERLREDIFEMAWHDMQAPLTVIRGSAELLLRLLSQPDQDVARSKHAAAMIVKHVDGLGELLTMLFDVSCLEAGVLSISRWPTDLGILATEVGEGLRTTNGHDIRVVAAEGITGEWDERRVRQVITCLLSNAIKYSPDDSRVTVSVTGDERSATVSVRDEGLGFDESERAQLFKRGYRTEAARSVSGRGLGLYLSHGIVGIHGGRMWAESPGPGKGSTFSFSLLRQPPETGTHDTSNGS